MKTKLTFRERIAVAHGYFNLGISQHHLAALYGVNAGRVAEVCTDIKDLFRAKDASEESQKLEKLAQARSPSRGVDKDSAARLRQDHAGEG